MSRSRNKGSRTRSPVSNGSKPGESKELFSSGLAGRISAWYRAKSPVLRFVVIFLLLGGLCYLATLSAFYRDIFFPRYLRWTAHLASPVCNWFGQHTTATATVISSDRFSIQIAKGCDALEPLTLFVVMVLAFPGPFRRKIPGILVGAVVLAVANLIRIVSLFLTGVYYPSAFESMHLEVWQTAFILLTVILWAFWIQWATKPRSTAHVSS